MAAPPQGPCFSHFKTAGTDKPVASRCHLPARVPFPQYAGRKPQIIRNVPSDGAKPSRVSVSEKAMANFWDSLNPDQRRAFEAKANKRVFPSGARIMREGEQGNHVAVLLSGLTEIRVREDGAERVIAERGPGQLIGERAALEVSPRSATVVAIQTVVALVLRTEDFAAFISTYPAVLRIVENQIYYRLREGTARYDAGPIRPATWRTTGRTAGPHRAGTVAGTRRTRRCAHRCWRARTARSSAPMSRHSARITVMTTPGGSSGGRSPS